MSWIAALLILTSAFMHALWNLVSKRRSPTLAFFFVASASGALVVSPLLVAQRELLPLIPPPVWGLILATGMAQGLYFTGLAGAYQHGDMSLAYPLARAVPVLSVAAISLLAGRGDAIAPISLAGMGLIFVGCLLLPLPHFRRLRLSDYTHAVYGMALLAATGTTGYTLIDDLALRQLRALDALSLGNTRVTLLFISLQTLSTATLLGLATLARAPERRRLVALGRNRSLLLTGALTGIVMMATYGLVLAAMAYVRDVSYVAAFRQLSIPIGAMLGMALLHEERYRPKLAGIAIISAGLLLVGLG